MLKLVNVFFIGLTAIVFIGVFGFNGFADDGKKKTVSPSSLSTQEQQVIDTIRQLGFSVQSAKPLANGSWEVHITGFDGRRASGAFRGAVVAPAANIGGGNNTAITRETGKTGRGGTVGPRGGGTISEQDGSATGGGNSGPEGSSGGGRNGGPLSGSENEGGGSATGGGGNQGPDQGSNPRGSGSVLRVSIAADGALVVDADSLRQAGFSNAVGSTSNGRVTFR